MGLPTGRSSSTPSSPSPAAASKGSLADADEDLLSHGALLDLGADVPAASAVAVAPGLEGRPDTSLVPTLSSASFEPASKSGDLLDPEILLGVAEPGGPARVDGTNGSGTLLRADAAPATTPIPVATPVSAAAAAVDGASAKTRSPSAASVGTKPRSSTVKSVPNAGADAGSTTATRSEEHTS